jgi:hypothetical protein
MAWETEHVSAAVGFRRVLFVLEGRLTNHAVVDEKVATR